MYGKKQKKPRGKLAWLLVFTLILSNIPGLTSMTVKATEMITVEAPVEVTPIAGDAQGGFEVTGSGKTLKFDDFGDAVDAALGMESAIITLKQDDTSCSYSGTWKQGDITIDLAGYRLEVEKINLNGGKLTFADSSAGKTGYFAADSRMDVNAGTLSVGGGTLCVYVCLKSTDNQVEMTMNGGTIEEGWIVLDKNSRLTVNGGNTAYGYFELYENAQMTVNGGSLKDGSVYLYGESLLTVNDGNVEDSYFELSGNSQLIVEDGDLYYNSIYLNDESQMALEGGNIYEDSIRLNDKSCLTVGNGTLSYNNISMYQDSILMIEGGTVADTYIIMSDASQMYMNAGNIEDSYIELYDGSHLTLDDGTIYYSCIDVYDNSWLTVNDAHVADADLYLYGGNIDITGGEIEAYCYIEEYKEISVVGGTFKDISVGKGTLGDLFTSQTCIKYADLNGDPIELDSNANHYSGVFSVIHNETHTGVELMDGYGYDSTNHWNKYPCGAQENVEAHTGGMATCSEMAVCKICKQSYGSKNSSNHTGDTEIRGAKKPTATVSGYTGDTYCKACGEKIAAGTIIPATGVDPNPGPVENPFGDVKENDWFYPYAMYAYENNLMAGTGEINGKVAFEPMTTMQRSMFVQVLYSIEGKPPVEYKDAFADVKENDWFADAVIWAKENDIVAGEGANFNVKGLITREQMVAILYKYAIYRGYGVAEAADLTDYTDEQTLTDYAVPGMKWAVAKGVIGGQPSGQGDSLALNPKGNASRAEAATMFMRFKENVEK